MKEKNYPRKISTTEITLLFSILPQEKSGYNEYRKILPELYVIGEGRFGSGNLLLGSINAKPDLTVSSSPVFAIGSVHTKSTVYDLVIHSIVDSIIEFQIEPYLVEDDFKIEKVITYSLWKPGMKAPEDGSTVYEYEIKYPEYMLAIAPSSKKIWLHDYKTGVNHIIPVSNFFNELMRLRNIKDDNQLKNPAKYFEKIDSFSSLELRLAFLMYNNYLKRFNLAGVLEKTLEEKVKKKKHLKFFGRGLN